MRGRAAFGRHIALQQATLKLWRPGYHARRGHSRFVAYRGAAIGHVRDAHIVIRALHTWRTGRRLWREAQPYSRPIATKSGRIKRPASTVAQGCLAIRGAIGLAWQSIQTRLGPRGQICPVGRTCPESSKSCTGQRSIAIVRASPTGVARRRPALVRRRVLVAHRASHQSSSRMAGGCDIWRCCRS